MVENVEAAGTGKEGEARRRRPMEVPAELDSRFLRMRHKLYKSAHDKQQVPHITPTRTKQNEPNHLHHLIRLAQEKKARHAAGVRWKCPPSWTLGSAGLATSSIEARTTNSRSRPSRLIESRRKTQTPFPI